MYHTAAKLGTDLRVFFRKANAERTSSLIENPAAPETAFAAWLMQQNYNDLCDVIPGIESISDGLHSKAIITSTAVIKTNVFGHCYHDGQAEWLRWCHANQNNPFVPKISLLEVDPITSRFMVVMEKLHPHAGHHQYSHRSKPINDALYQAFKGGGQARWDQLERDLKIIRLELLETIEELNHDIKLCNDRVEHELVTMWTKEISDIQQALCYIDQLMDLHRQRRSLYPFFRRMRKMMTAAAMTGIEIDMHPGNWMIRVNGSPVFLDPLN